jgi:nucleoid-associated protein YgaU
MRDPFRPNPKTQLVREAQIGLSVVAIVLSLFLYVAFYRITGRGRHLPDHVRSAPISETIWPNVIAAKDGAPSAPNSSRQYQPSRVGKTTQIATRIAAQQGRKNMFDLDRPAAHAAPSFDSLDGDSKSTLNAKVKNSTGQESLASNSMFGHANGGSASLSQPSNLKPVVDEAGDPNRVSKKQALAKRLSRLIGFDGPVEKPKLVAAEKTNKEMIRTELNDLSLKSQVVARSEIQSPGSKRLGSVMPNKLRSKKINDSSFSDVNNNDFHVQLASGTSSPIGKVDQPRSNVGVLPDATDQRSRSRGVHLPVTKPKTAVLEMAGGDWPKAAGNQPMGKAPLDNAGIEPPKIASPRPSQYVPSTPLRKLPKPLVKTQVKESEDKSSEVKPSEVIASAGGDFESGIPLRPKPVAFVESKIETNALLGDFRKVNEIVADQDLMIGEKKAVENREPHQSTYVSREGDSFWSVAEKVYDDPRYFNALYKHNQTVSPSFNALAAGTQLATPTKTVLRKLYPNESPASEAGQGEAATRFYVTRPGDTLWGIAGDRLGQASRYLDVYQANQARLDSQTDPNAELPVGVRLVLPLR